MSVILALSNQPHLTHWDLFSYEMISILTEKASVVLGIFKTYSSRFTLCVVQELLTQAGPGNHLQRNDGWQGRCRLGRTSSLGI